MPYDLANADRQVSDVVFDARTRRGNSGLGIVIVIIVVVVVRVIEIFVTLEISIVTLPPHSRGLVRECTECSFVVTAVIQRYFVHIFLCLGFLMLHRKPLNVGFRV